MIKLEDLISVMNDATDIVLRAFNSNNKLIFNGTIEEFKQSLYDTYKDNRVVYIEPYNLELVIYIMERKL